MKKLLLITLLALFVRPCAGSEFVLVRDGKPVAVINPMDNDSVRKTAILFNKYIREITGTELQMKHLKGGYQIRFQLVSPETFSSYTHPDNLKNKEVLNDAFSIKVKRGFMFISATTIRGLENAVYSFLEKYAGVRHYAHDAIVIPTRSTFIVPEMDWLDAPAFAFRVPYYYEATFQNYIDFHKLSASPKDTDKPSWPVSNEWGLWVHTLHTLLPPDKWFNAKPEYYALRNGIRTPDQVCLSNPEVLEIVYQNLKEQIEANPSAKYWSVSQMDNFNYCQCDQCRATDSVEGSPSGTMLRFVNQLAARFPDKVISTLAYQYTRKAPAVTKPLPNVNIMLCTIECNRNVPIEADTSIGSFYHDLKSWSALTNNILIWDYVINFSHLLAPFPNFKVLGPNLRLFDHYGAAMMFEQGLRGTRGGEFSELRCYVLSKLLWNPYLDADSLVNDFVNGYYGKQAAPYIMEYITRMEDELDKSGKALTLYEPPFTHSTGYLSPGNLKEYFRIFNNALAACKEDSVASHRVLMAMQSVKYAWLEVSKSLPFTDDWIFKNQGDHQLKPGMVEMLNELVDTAIKYGPEIFHETSIPPEEYRMTMMNYFKEGIAMHKGVGKKTDYITKAHELYKANGDQSLVDGVRGTQACQMLWQGWWGDDLEVTIDLDSSQKVNRVKVGYLDDNQSWIMAPGAVEVWISDDGNTFRSAGTVLNKQAGEKLKKHHSSLTVEVEGALSARFVKVKVANIGKLPAWRGVDGDAWLFVDEMEIY